MTLLAFFVGEDIILPHAKRNMEQPLLDSYAKKSPKI